MSRGTPPRGTPFSNQVARSSQGHQPSRATSSQMAGSPSCATRKPSRPAPAGPQEGLSVRGPAHLQRPRPSHLALPPATPTQHGDARFRSFPGPPPKRRARHLPAALRTPLPAPRPSPSSSASSRAPSSSAQRLSP
jgi:hypothetical protein